MLKGLGPTGFGYASTAEQVTEGMDLSGRTYLVTGCNSGLGAETARVLTLRGARVIGAARTEDKARAALESLGTAGEIVPLACDLSEPAHVRAAIEAVGGMGTVDGIIANAGIMALPERTLKHGHELQFLTNHLGHALLVLGLLGVLADDGRVVVVSSAAHRRAPEGGIRFGDPSFEHDYEPWVAYGQSKLANLLFAKHLATCMPKPDQVAFSVHPGVISTNLGRHLGRGVNLLAPLANAVAFKSIPEGAATQTWAAVHPDAPPRTGAYLADCNIREPSGYGKDSALAAKLYEATEGWLAALR